MCRNQNGQMMDDIFFSLQVFFLKVVFFSQFSHDFQLEIAQVRFRGGS